MAVKKLKSALVIILIFIALFIFLWAPRQKQPQIMDDYADTLFSSDTVHPSGVYYRGEYLYIGLDGLERTLIAVVPPSSSDQSANSFSFQAQMRGAMIKVADSLALTLPENFMKDVKIVSYRE